MMTDQEERRDATEDDQTKMMIFALQKFKAGGNKIISSSQLKESMERMEKRKKERKIIKKKRSMAKIYKKVPNLDALREIDPSINWEQRDLLFDAGMISIIKKIISSFRSHQAPEGLIQAMEELKDSMINLDANGTKNGLFELVEKWGASSNSNDITSHHLLRAFIRIMFDTYPLGD